MFQNLGIVNGAVDNVIDSALSEIEKIATESLDVTLTTNQDLGKRAAPGRAAIPSPGSSGNLRTRIWDNLERLFQDTLYTYCLQVIKEYLFHMPVRNFCLLRKYVFICLLYLLFQIELLQRILLEHHTKELDELSQTFWDKVNSLLSKVLVERAQGKY